MPQSFKCHYAFRRNLEFSAVSPLRISVRFLLPTQQQMFEVRGGGLVFLQIGEWTLPNTWKAAVGACAFLFGQALVG